MAEDPDALMEEARVAFVENNGVLPLDVLAALDAAGYEINEIWNQLENENG